MRTAVYGADFKRVGY